MNNGLMLIGRLVEDPVIRETESGKKVSSIKVAVPRNYKNKDGIYETDFFDCNVWGMLADSTREYCKKGDMVGIKGRLENNNYEKDGVKHYTNEINVEKITFLASSIKKTEENKSKDEEIEKNI